MLLTAFLSSVRRSLERVHDLVEVIHVLVVIQPLERAQDLILHIGKQRTPEEVANLHLLLLELHIVHEQLELLHDQAAHDVIELFLDAHAAQIALHLVEHRAQHIQRGVFEIFHQLRRHRPAHQHRDVKDAAHTASARGSLARHCRLLLIDRVFLDTELGDVRRQIALAQLKAGAGVDVLLDAVVHALHDPVGELRIDRDRIEHLVQMVAVRAVGDGQVAAAAGHVQLLLRVGVDAAVVFGREREVPGDKTPEERRVVALLEQHLISFVQIRHFAHQMPPAVQMRGDDLALGAVGAELAHDVIVGRVILAAVARERERVLGRCELAERVCAQTVKRLIEHNLVFADLLVALAALVAEIGLDELALETAELLGLLGHAPVIRTGIDHVERLAARLFDKRGGQTAGFLHDLRHPALDVVLVLALAHDLRLTLQRVDDVHIHQIAVLLHDRIDKEAQNVLLEDVREILVVLRALFHDRALPWRCPSFLF